MKMNDRITLLKRESGRDAAGQPAETWPGVTTIWAHVKFETGAQVLRANADISVVRVSIRIRARTDVDQTFRVRHKGVEYDVKSVIPDSSDRAFMFLVCEATR